ncbi:MAG: hypothetical protein CMF39_03825 [Legionellaceae bacterium]|nr:hypothetical protein [Legionellaceae bacterium]
MSVTSLCLSACATSSTSNQFVNGKTAFQQGQYNDAFSSLMPAAKKGNPEAQYAIGYMYFYGKGTQQNTLLAQQWFEKSAKQHYPKAKTALQLLSQQNQQENRVFTGPANQLMK